LVKENKHSPIIPNWGKSGIKHTGIR